MKRGPKPFRPSAKQRRLVSLWSAAGITQQTIARMIRVAPNTLVKHFENELKAGPEAALARNLVRFERAAENGNVQAMRYLHEQLKQQLMVENFKPEVLAAADEIEATDRDAKKGKKEQRLDAAKRAGEGDPDWAADLAALNAASDVQGHC